MKIAICTNFFLPSIGGAELVVKRIADYFVSQNIEVCVFTRFLVNRNSRNLNGIKISDYNLPHASEYVRKIKSFDPDFVFIYSDMFDFLFETLANFNNIILAFCGGNRFLSSHSLVGVLKKHIKKIKAFVCHSNKENDYDMCRKLDLLNLTHIVPNGIDIEEFDNNNKTRKELGCDDDSGWLLNVANFFPGKGQEYLIDIILSIKKRPLTYVQVCSTSSFSICNELESRWKKNCSKLLNNDVKVVLFKNKKREEIISIFKNSNVFVFPSLKESFGLVFLESMAASLPWVSANIGIAPEIDGGQVVVLPKDKNNNCIFNRFAINQFAEKTEHLLEHQEVGLLGRKMVEEKYQWKNILPLYSQLF